MAKLQFICCLVLLLAALDGSFAQPWRRPPAPDCCQCAIGIPIICRVQCGGVPVCPPDYNPYPDQPPAPVDNYDGYTLFTFGDSFADNGNLPEIATADIGYELVRSWYSPYASSYGNDDGSYASNKLNFTGRFSNYMVQSDFVARMLGLDMAPRPRRQQGDSSCDDTGMTFATAGSGVYSVRGGAGVPTLSQQVDAFANLVSSNNISPARLAKSVALVAVSGNDYDRVGVAHPSAFGDISAFARNVTSAISDSVDRLRGLGVPKVLVNNLPPFGCMPGQTRALNHTKCDGAGNTGAVTHNENLAHLMEGKDGVLVVDLHSAFNGIVTGESESASHFKNRLTPCCEGINPKDFCADTGNDGTGLRNLYSLCSNPKVHFYWDEMHPTQAGWTAVMAQVEDSIKQFVGVA